MKSDRQLLGKSGEDLAAKYLQDKGLEIIQQNYRAGRGEIDLICKDSDSLVVVEVKSVRVPGFGSGEERIPLKKQKKIIATTYAFLDEYPEFSGFGVRFDAVVVNFDKYPVRISHYESAFWQQLS